MRSGVTLLELMVAVAIVALITSAGLVALGQPRTVVPAFEWALDSVRADAIRSGASRMADETSGGRVRFLPDGRIVRLRARR